MPKLLSNIDDFYTIFAKEVFNNKHPWIKLDDPDKPWDEVELIRLQYKITLPIQECYPSSQSANVWMDIITKHLKAMHKELVNKHEEDISFTFDEIVNPKPVQILGGDRFMCGDKL